MIKNIGVPIAPIGPMTASFLILPFPTFGQSKLQTPVATLARRSGAALSELGTVATESQLQPVNAGLDCRSFVCFLFLASVVCFCTDCVVCWWMFKGWAMWAGCGGEINFCWQGHQTLYSRMINHTCTWCLDRRSIMHCGWSWHFTIYPSHIVVLGLFAFRTSITSQEDTPFAGFMAKTRWTPPTKFCVMHECIIYCTT